MVPNGTAYSNYPPFANNGTKTPPGGSPESAKYALGMVPADTFPAEWANYLFHGATAGITRLNLDTGSIKKELNSILAAYNITNDASAFNQLLQVFNKLYPQIASCDTAAQTEVKAVAVQGDIQHAGTIYVIDMTNGNTYGDGSTTYPKISINSGTAYPICDANGQYVGSGAWAAGDTITVLFTGSKFLMATRAPINSLVQGSLAPVTSGAVYQIVQKIELPIGSWMAFENDTAPNDTWVKAGETYSAGAYPSLYAMLGSTTVPNRYDKSRLGALETITISTTSATPTEMQYDGILYIKYSERGSTPGRYYLNGTEVITFGGGYSSAESGVTFIVSKGDTVYCTLPNATPACNARFYKHPLFIKAK